MARLLLGIGFALLGAAALAAALWAWATGWHPSAERYPLQGLDLAERPPEGIEWNVVRAQGADFAYLVATSGADRRDPGFQSNWEALPRAGMRRGAVHLWSLCQPAVAQANAFNTFVPATVDALPMAVDVQYRADCDARPSRAALVAGLRRFADMVETHTGKPLLLRLSKEVEEDYRLGGAIDRPLWVMANYLTPDYTARPWRMWRASDRRRIGGIDEPVNWDVVAP